MAAYESLESVQKNIELQKELIQTIDDSIKKITGRPPDEERRNDVDLSVRQNRRFMPAGSSLSVFSRIATPIDPIRFENPDDIKVSVPSSVVRVGEKRSRSDAIKEYKSSDKERGRRMFGVLQATLTQFKAEAVGSVGDEALRRRQQRREEIEGRIEAKAAEEKVAARLERANLFRQRREQQVELGLLQQKMRMMHDFEDWKEEMMKMIGFIRTTRNPPIFYRPKSDNKESEKRKDTTRATIIDLIEERRRHVEAEYSDLASARRRRLGVNAPHNVVGGAEDAEKGGETVDTTANITTTPDATELPLGDGSPQRRVHITKKSTLAPSAVDFDDLEDEPVLMDEEPDRRLLVAD